MKRLFLLLIPLAMMLSCTTKLTESLSKTTEITDSKLLVKDSTSYKDSIHHTKPDSSQITASVIIDKQGQVNMPEIITETPVSKSSVSITNGKLTAKCLCKEQELLIKEKQRIIERLSTETSKKQDIQYIKTTVRVPFIPWWAKILCWVGAISLVYRIIRVAWWLIKKYYKPI